MKKKIALVAAVILLAGSLSACGKKAEYVRDITASDYVTLGEYTGIEVTVDEPTSVARKNADGYLVYLHSINTNLTEVTDRTVVKEGDMVNIDYAGYRDGVAFDGGTAADQNLLIGSGAFIPGFEDGLIGKEVGETVMLDLTFPADYKSEEMAGAEVTFEVVINGIFISELTVEFINEAVQSDFSTIEEFEDYLYNMYYEEAVSSNEKEIASTIARAVMANCIFKEPPEEMVERYCDMQINDMTTQLAAYGTDLNTYMQTYYGMNSEEYMQVFKQDAATMAQQYIMFQAIADAEGLNPTEEEIAQVTEVFTEETEESLYEYVIAEKVMDFLKENAEIHVE